MASQYIYTAQKAHVDELAAALAAEKSYSTFASGGKLRIASIAGVPTTTTTGNAASAELNIRPVTIRFRPAGSGLKLIL